MSSPLFHKALYAFRQSDAPPPTRKDLAVQVYDNVRTMKREVVDQLRSCAGVTVGMDGWTNVRHEKVINLVPVASGVAYYWDSVVLTARSTAEAQRPLIAAGVNSIVSEGVVVLGISSDNEGVNYALFELLSKQFPFLIHVPCAAHTIQLCVKYALAHTLVADVLKGMDALLYAFDSSKRLRHALAELQTTLRPFQTPLKLMPYNSTRWSSRLRAAERILKLKNCIIAMKDEVIAHLRSLKRTSFHPFTFDEFWWHSLLSLTAFLTPYQIATDVVQSDTSSLMDVYYQFLDLCGEADKLEMPHPLAGMRQSIIDILRMQWYGDGKTHRSHVNRLAIIMCAIFSFDDEYDRLFSAEDVTAANEWFRGWAVEFIVFYNLSYEKGRTAIEGLIWGQYDDWKDKKRAFSPLNTWLRLQRQGLSSQRTPAKPGEPLSSRRRWDARPVWRMTVKTARELTACALALLSLTASEAAVERTFSKQGLVHSKLRNSLSSESVQAQMFIAFNHVALRKSEEDQQEGAWVDISQDIEHRPRARGIFLKALPNDALIPLPSEPIQPTLPPPFPQPQVDIAADSEGGNVGGEMRVDSEEGEGAVEAHESDWEEEEKDVDMDEKESKEEETPSQRMTRFITRVVASMRITRRFRFNSDMTNVLAQEMQVAGISDTVTHVQMLIRQYLSSDPEDE
jgi:hypothetical protein